MVATPSDGSHRPQQRSSCLPLDKEDADKDLETGEQGQQGPLRPLRRPGLRPPPAPALSSSLLLGLRVLSFQCLPWGVLRGPRLGRRGGGRGLSLPGQRDSHSHSFWESFPDTVWGGGQIETSGRASVFLQPYQGRRGLLQRPRSPAPQSYPCTPGGPAMPGCPGQSVAHRPPPSCSGGTECRGGRWQHGVSCSLGPGARGLARGSSAQRFHRASERADSSG